MDFIGRLGPSDPGGSSRRSTAPLTNSTSSSSPRSKKKLIMLSILAAVLILASAISAVLVTVIRFRASPGDQTAANLHGKPTQAISRTCSKTRFPSLCINSLLDFPGSTTASEEDLVHISFNMTLRHISRAFYASTSISFASMEPRVRAAYNDCLELLEDSMDAIARSLTSVAPPSALSSGSEIKPATTGSSEDVMTWLSAALTNQDTCAEGLEETTGSVKDQMVNNLKDLSELVSNCLAIFSASGNGDFSGVPIQNKRRLMGTSKEEKNVVDNRDISRKFPKWLNRRDRRLLSLPVSAIQADIVVSKNGNGTVKTIAEAIKKAPEHSNRRFIIYVRAGRYEENNLKVGRKKTNVMFIGDGKGKTVITGKKSVGDGMTTFHTASFEHHKDEENPAGKDEDTEAQVAPIVRLEEVVVSTGFGGAAFCMRPKCFDERTGENFVGGRDEEAGIGREGEIGDALFVTLVLLHLCKCESLGIGGEFDGGDRTQKKKKKENAETLIC